MGKRLKLAGIGCGGRTRTYMMLAARMPQYYEVVAGADPNEERLRQTKDISCNPNFRCFKDDREILSQPKLADVMIIGTQDSHHFEPCIKAMEKGYDILLEKPIATNISDVIALERMAVKLGRKVLVCHVLRYTPFYTKVKEIIDSGALGEIATLNASEGVDPWHQTHSYVRGHWAVTANATPMIVAKSCHDMDIISWLIGRKCETVSSFGSLTYFTSANAPKGAPTRCVKGCPVGQSCHYNAMHYLGRHRRWLQYVFDHSKTASDDEIIDWLAKSPWGRCVYRCDNTAVDRQVVSMDFDGNANSTFTMTAFSQGRNIEICGTKAVLRGGEFTKHNLGCDIVVSDHATGDTTKYSVNADVGGYAGHAGGDPGLVMNLYEEMSKNDPAQMRSSITQSLQSHLMGYAAEESRLSGKTIDLNDFLLKNS